MACQILVDTGCKIESRHLRRLDLPVKKNTRILAMRFLNPFQLVQTCHPVLIRLVKSRLPSHQYWDSWILSNLSRLVTQSWQDSSSLDVWKIWSRSSLVFKGYFRCTKLIPILLFCGPQLFWGSLGKNLHVGRWWGWIWGKINDSVTVMTVNMSTCADPVLTCSV